jgi:hypothetical protein
MIDLVGAIDVDAHGIHVIQVEHADAMALQPLRRGLGTRHGAAEPTLDRGDLVDEEIRRAASADSQDRALTGNRSAT